MTITTKVWPSQNEFPVGPINPTRFQLAFPKLPHLEMFCNVVILPNVNLGMATQSNRILDLKQPGEKLYFNTLECTFLIDNKMKNYFEIFSWMKRISTSGLNKDSYADCHLLTDVGTFVFENSFPISLGNAVFDATATDINYPSCQVSFAYDQFVPRLS